MGLLANDKSSSIVTPEDNNLEEKLRQLSEFIEVNTDVAAKYRDPHLLRAALSKNENNVAKSYQYIARKAKMDEFSPLSSP